MHTLSFSMSSCSTRSSPPAYVYVYMCTYIWIHARTHARPHAHTHTRAHTCIHTHMERLHEQQQCRTRSSPRRDLTMLLYIHSEFLFLFVRLCTRDDHGSGRVLVYKR